MSGKRPIAPRWRRIALCGLALAAVGCGSSGGGPTDGGGPAADGSFADAGGVPDAGSTADAGAPADAGFPPDASVPPDAGSCADLCACAERGPPSYAGADAGAPTATSSAAQRQALIRVNRWRTSAGLPALDAHPQVEQAASAHAAFLAGNDEDQCWPTGGHDEVELGCTGFTGVRPGDRVAAAGYSYSLVTEVLDWVEDVDDAVDTWVWTVYHRRSFFQWRFWHLGYARVYGPRRDRQAWHNVLNFAAPYSGGAPRPSAPIVFPVPGQTGVPLSFDGDLEIPEPPSPPAGWPSGAVVSLHFPRSAWSVTTHRLLRASSCTDVAHIFATRDNDPNLAARSSDEAFLYAHAPLVPDTEYVVAIDGTLSGAPFQRTWSFTTAP